MIYVTSDLHGYPLEKFKALLKKVNFSDDDFLYVLGDVIDRGTDGVNLLLWLMNQPNVELLLGNHEAMFLSCTFIFDEITDDSINNFDIQKMNLLTTWLSNGAEPTLKALKQLSGKSPETLIDLIDFVKDAPLFDTVTTDSGDFVLVHSGFGNFSLDKKLREYTEDELIWTRPKITDKYFDNITTVFGHTPTVYYGESFKERALITDTWIDIDVGAGLGLNPMLLRLDDMKEIYT